jgi:tetratricopeptide (TPR) repeat protein
VLSSVPDSSFLKLKKDLVQARLFVCQASWNRAESAIQNVLASDPNQATIYILLSRLHPSRFEKYGFKNREQLYQQALRLNPAYETAYLALGDWYYFNQHIERAESIYRRLLEISPRSIDGLLALGKLYLYRNESLQLIRTYERVFEIRPQNPDILYNLGIAYYNVQNYKKSQELFETAASRYNHPNAYYYLGAIHLKQGRLDQALQAFRKRIHVRKGPNDTFADEAVKHVYQILQQQKQNKNGDHE